VNFLRLLRSKSEKFTGLRPRPVCGRFPVPFAQAPLRGANYLVGDISAVGCPKLPSAFNCIVRSWRFGKCVRARRSFFSAFASSRPDAKGAVFTQQRRQYRASIVVSGRARLGFPKAAEQQRVCAVDRGRPRSKRRLARRSGPSHVGSSARLGCLAAPFMALCAAALPGGRTGNPWHVRCFTPRRSTAVV
jgi:hypothetical protein